MYIIALRNLFQEKSRLVISVGGVAFAIILMIALFGMYAGSIDRDVRFMQKAPADIVAMRKGMSDVYYGVPIVSLSDIERLRNEPEIKSVVPVISLRPTVHDGDRQFVLFLSSFDPTDDEQGPWSLIEGTQQIGDNEILIASTMAKKLGKKVGDTIQFSESDKEWRIAGLVPGASSFGNNYSWITFEAAREFVKIPETVSFAWIQLYDPSRAVEVVERLKESYPALNLREREALVEDQKRGLDESFLPILQAILMIAVVIGTAVIGLTIYTATLDKSREVGILKAIGVSNRQLYGVVLVQALLTTLVGLSAGIILSYGVGFLLTRYMDLEFLVMPAALWSVVGLSLGMGIIASFVPVKRLVAIDPAEVFKS